MKHFISDIHADHQSMLDVRRRVIGDFDCFKNLESWQSFIFGKINSCLEKGDILYLLGDFSFGDPQKFRNQIKGGVSIFLVRGNHDPSIQKCEQVFGVGQVREQMDIKVNGHRCFLSHYPTAFWPASHHGSFHVYGHTHSQREETMDQWMPGRRSMEVCPENIYKIFGDIRPINEMEIYNLLINKPGHDHKEFYIQKSGIINKSSTLN
jgi:calcineurin-like phosphoesterase family protein